MPRRTTTPGMTRESAGAYVDLAGAASGVARKRGELESWGESLDKHPRYRSFGKKTVQALRRMILARETFGSRFQGLLEKYGSTKLEWIASLPDALELVAGKRFQLGDGTFTTLEDVSTSELQRELPRMRERRTGDMNEAAGGSLKMFDVVGDIVAMRHELTSRLKSLRHALPDGTMRFKVTLPKLVSRPLRVDSVVQEAKRLYDILLPFMGFLDLLANGKDSSMVTCSGKSAKRKNDSAYEFEGRIVDAQFVERLAATEAISTERGSSRRAGRTS